MATTVGSLAVKLTADGSSFTSAMSRSSKSVGAFTRVNAAAGQNLQALTRRVNVAGSAVAGFGRKLAGLATAALAIGAGVGITAGINRSAEAIDKLAKKSDLLGIPIERLSGLQHAAGLTGVEVNALETGLQRMTRRISEAAKGTGEARGALAELGIDAKALAALSPDQQFSAIAGAMDDVANQGDRVRLAMKLFDSEGVGLLNTLKLGAGGLAEVQARAEELGLTMSRVDAAKVEAMNDAVAELQGAFTGLFNEALVHLAPLIEAGAEALTDFIVRGDGLRSKVGPAIQWVAGAVGTVIDVFDLARAGVITLGAAGLKASQMIIQGLQKLGEYGVREIRAWVNLANIASAAVGQPLNIRLPQADFSALEEQAEFLGNMTDSMTLQATQAWDRAMAGEGKKKALAWFADVQAAAESAAQAVAAAGGTGAGLEFDPAAAARVQDALSGLRAELDGIGSVEVPDVLAKLRADGATVAQLEEAARLVDAIAAKGEAVEAIEVRVEGQKAAMQQLEELRLEVDALGRKTIDVRIDRLNLNELFPDNAAGPLGLNVGAIARGKVELDMRAAQQQIDDFETIKDIIEPRLSEAERLVDVFDAARRAFEAGSITAEQFERAGHAVAGKLADALAPHVGDNLVEAGSQAHARLAAGSEARAIGEERAQAVLAATPQAQPLPTPQPNGRGSDELARRAARIDEKMGRIERLIEWGNRNQSTPTVVRL